jgi:hypothetical protein
MINTKLQTTLKVFFTIAFLIATERFCHKKTRGFRDHKVLSTFAFDSRYSIASCMEDKELHTLLSQPFYFLGDGGQGYSFVSEDGNYVLKFFKLHHVRVPSWLRSCNLGPLEGIKKRFIAERDKDKERMLTSCKIAATTLQELTAAVFAHINTTDGTMPRITLYDAIGAIHSIDLNKAVFAIQRKAELAFTHLKKDIENHNEVAVKKVIDDFLTFLQKRCELGVEDRDTGLKRNFGYLDGRLMEIDMGSFVENKGLIDPHLMKDEIARKGQDLRAPLSERYPSMLPYYDQSLERVVLEAASAKGGK